MFELIFSNMMKVLEICEGFGVNMALDTVGDGQVTVVVVVVVVVVMMMMMMVVVGYWRR